MKLFGKTKDRAILTGRAVALGMNEAAGLKPSAFLKKRWTDTALTEDGYISLLHDLGEIYKNSDGTPKKRGSDVMHCDYTAVHIARIFDTQGFEFSVNYLTDIHKNIFADIYAEAGSYRADAVIGNRTGKWSNHEWTTAPEDISASLARLFAANRAFFSKKTPDAAAPKTLASFTVELWQIHPFSFANTRTIVLFLVKYLQSIGYAEGAYPLWEQAIHFRESLILANPEAKAAGVEVITRPLEATFEIILRKEVF